MVVRLDPLAAAAQRDVVVVRHVALERTQHAKATRRARVEVLAQALLEPTKRNALNAARHANVLAQLVDRLRREAASTQTIECLRTKS